MMRARDFPRLTVFLCLLLCSSFVFAQVPQLPPEMVRDQLRIRGDSVSFCLNEQGYLAQFEEALARELTEVLLLNPRFFTYVHRDPPRPYDYSLSVDLDDLYYLLINECDVFMSLSLAGDTGLEWLRLTEPLFSTGFVMAVLDESEHVESLMQLPGDSVVGARYMSQAHLDLGALNRARPLSERWQVLPYDNNPILFERLLDGTLDAIAIWEPALVGLSQDLNEVGNVRILNGGEARFRTLQFSFGLLSRDTFLLESLDAAIEELRASGRLDALMRVHLWHELVE